MAVLIRNAGKTTALFALTIFICSNSGCSNGGGKGRIGKIKDEALSAVPPRLPSSFKFADEDFFHDMDQTKDGHLTLTADKSTAATCGWYGRRRRPALGRVDLEELRHFRSAENDLLARKR